MFKILKGGDSMLIIAGTEAKQSNYELPENFVERALADILEKAKRAKQNLGFDKPLEISYSLTDKPDNEFPLVGTLTIKTKV
jgi:hypothetical protein